MGVLGGALSEGGVLAINVLSKDMTDLLGLVNMVRSGGLGVCYLENRDKSHSWMVTPDNKIVIATKVGPRRHAPMCPSITDPPPPISCPRVFPHLASCPAEGTLAPSSSPLASFVLGRPRFACLLSVC